MGTHLPFVDIFPPTHLCTMTIPEHMHLSVAQTPSLALYHGSFILFLSLHFIPFLLTYYFISLAFTSSFLHPLTSSLSSPLPTGSQMNWTGHQWSGRW